MYKKKSIYILENKINIIQTITDFKYSIATI